VISLEEAHFTRNILVHIQRLAGQPYAAAGPSSATPAAASVAEKQCGTDFLAFGGAQSNKRPTGVAIG
jgi:hypothetical protein